MIQPHNSYMKTNQTEDIPHSDSPSKPQRFNTLSKSSSGTASYNEGTETNGTSMEDLRGDDFYSESTGQTSGSVQKDVSQLVPAIEILPPSKSSIENNKMKYPDFTSLAKPLSEDENNFKVSIPLDSNFVKVHEDTSSSTSSSDVTECADQNSATLSNQFRSLHQYRILSEPQERPETNIDTISVVDPLVPNAKTVPHVSEPQTDISDYTKTIPKSQTFPRLSIDEPSQRDSIRGKKMNPVTNTNSSTTRSSLDRRTFHSINTIKIPDDYLKTELAVYPEFDVHHRLSYVNMHKPHLSLKSVDGEAIKRMRLSKTSSFINNSRMKSRMKADDLYQIPGQNISITHQNYAVVYDLVTGIRSSVSRCAKIPKPITSEEFTKVSKLIFNRQGTTEAPPTKYEFKFKDYAPEVFRDLRRMFNVNQADYLISLNDEIGVRAVGSSGKSGSSFYYSNDRKFIIKTIHRSEHKHLRRILKDYYHYVKNNPNTLLCQFYGLHRLKMMTRTGVVKVHVLVMNNMLPPTVRMSDCYDLKGSTHGRKTIQKKIAQGSCMKDLNFIENNAKINLTTSKKKQVIDQLTKDVELLERLNIMDYSLLVGIRYLNISEEEVAERCQRVSMIVHQNVPDAHKNTIFEADGGIRAVDVDGEDMEMVYYIGIIDCLTNYNTFKRLETFFRTLRHKREVISAVPPNEYGSRFLKFITANIRAPGDSSPSKKSGRHALSTLKKLTKKNHTA